MRRTGTSRRLGASIEVSIPRPEPLRTSSQACTYHGTPSYPMPYGGSRTRGAVSVGLRRMHSRLGRPSPVVSNRHDNEPGLGQRFNQVGRVTSSQPDQVGVPGATASRPASWPRQRPQRLVVDVGEHQGRSGCHTATAGGSCLEPRRSCRSAGVQPSRPCWLTMSAWSCTCARTTWSMRAAACATSSRSSA